MSKVYYTADWHLGHKGISDKFRTQFSSDEEHNLTIINNYKELVTKRDVVFFLGDICFDKASLNLIADLPGDKRLVLGNHENQYEEFRTIQLWHVFDKVYGLHQRKGCWLSHAPIHSLELRGKYNIHGHVHNATLTDARYANVSLENCNYYPVDFQDIKASLEDGKVFTA